MTDQQPTGQDLVDLAHGALIHTWPRLRGWLDEDREALLEREAIREAAQEWHTNGRDDGYLAHRNDRLEAARAVATHPHTPLNALEQAYLRASTTAELTAQRERADLAETARRESERRVAQQRVFLRIAAALVILAVSAAAIAMIFRARAEAQRDVSLARALAAQAIGEHDRGDDQRAALLARQAWLFDPEGAAREQIGTALQATVGAPFFSTIWRDADRPVQPLTSLAMDGAGRYLAATSMNDPTLRIWDLADPARPPLRLVCHGRTATAVAFSPDGAALVSGGATGSVIVWDTGDLEAVFAAPESVVEDDCRQSVGATVLEAGARRGKVRAVAFAPRGEGGAAWVVAGGCGQEAEPCADGAGMLRFWDAAAPGPPVILEVPEGDVWSVAVNAAGNTLAAGSCRRVLPRTEFCDTETMGTIAIWDLPDDLFAMAGPSRILGEPSSGHTGGVAALAFHPRDGRLASGGGDRVIRLWDLGQSQPVPETLTGHDAEIRALAFSPDGALLASGGQDETVRLWDLSRRTPERAIAVLGGSEEWVRALAFAQTDDEVTLAATSAGGTARVWRIARAERGLTPPRILRGHDHYVRGLAFAPDGTTLASTGEDGTIRLWGGAATVTAIDDVDGDTLGDDEVKVTAVAYSADGAFLAAGDARGQVWVQPQGEAAAFVPIGRHDAGVTAVAFDPVSGRLASGGMDGTVRLWNPTTNAAVGEPLVVGGISIRAVAFAPDGATLAAVGCRLGGSGSCDFDSGAVVLWRIAPAGPSLAIGAALFRCAAGRASLGVGAVGEAPSLCGERGVASLAFGPVGLPLLASGHADGAILLWDRDRLWDGDAIAPVGQLEGHDGEVRTLAFSPGGLLASGATDQTARLWAPALGEPAGQTTRLGDPLHWVQRTLRGAPEPGPALAIVGGREEFVRALAFDPRDGRTLASAAADGTIRLSIASSSALANRVCAQVWRNLSRAEWDRFVGADVPYQPTCPNLGPGHGP